MSNQAFLVLNLGILVFHEILQLEKLDGVYFNMTILFSNSSPIYPNKAFLVSILGIFVYYSNFFSLVLFLYQTLQQGKLEDADVK